MATILEENEMKKSSCILSLILVLCALLTGCQALNQTLGLTPRVYSYPEYYWVCDEIPMTIVFYDDGQGTTITCPLLDDTSNLVCNCDMGMYFSIEEVLQGAMHHGMSGDFKFRGDEFAFQVKSDKLFDGTYAGHELVFRRVDAEYHPSETVSDTTSTATSLDSGLSTS